MDCPHCQGRFGAHVPGCSNAGKSSEHMEIEHLRDKIEKLEAENERLSTNKWLQMENAPKDGTRIILDWGGKARVGFYLDNIASQVPWQGWRVPSMEEFPGGPGPRRWMPLPETETHPLSGLHINQGSMDAAAEAYEAEYNAAMEGE